MPTSVSVLGEASHSQKNDTHAKAFHGTALCTRNGECATALPSLLEAPSRHFGKTKIKYWNLRLFPAVSVMPELEQPSDVLRQFCHGGLDAFEALFRRHQREVYGWIVRIVRDPAAAEDLTVETRR